MLLESMFLISHTKQCHHCLHLEIHRHCLDQLSKETRLCLDHQFHDGFHLLNYFKSL